jgi:threonylcarbamoyladenosine tRNA methylthiotransferase MtaB
MVDVKSNGLLEISDVDFFVNNRNKNQIIQIITGLEINKLKFENNIFTSQDDGRFKLSTKNMNKHSRAFLKIQDGCDNRCSYCIVPFARGNAISRDLEEIIDEINDFASSGYEEVVLTGINLASYKNKKNDFYDLLEILTDRFSSIRFRISSIEPEFINERFISIIRNKKNICPHFHIPLQSGSNKILKLMNRKYSVEEYKNKIDLLRKVLLNPFISTDLILGFPEESNEIFYEIYNFVKNINFAFIHIFGFSPRKGTAIYDYKYKVPERVRDERIRIVKDLAEDMNKNYRESFLNKELEILIEKKNGENYFGKSENYLNLHLRTKLNLQLKKRYRVVLKKINKDDNICEMEQLMTGKFI